MGAGRAKCCLAAAEPPRRLELVAGAVAFGGEVGFVEGAVAGDEGNARGDLDALIRQAADLRRVVGEEADARGADGLQHLSGDAEIALVHLEPQSQIGVDRVETLILQPVGAQLVEEADAAPFLLQIEEDAAKNFSSCWAYVIESSVYDGAALLQGLHLSTGDFYRGDDQR